MMADKKISTKANMKHFREAMQHFSTKYEDVDKTYERLEYLGDAIFHLVLTEYLFKRYDEENEGFLTRLRIRLERGDSMAELARKLELDLFIQVDGINVNEHILEDVFESFIGAFYLNYGMKYTRILIIKLIEKFKNLSELISHDDNYKDLLLRYFHQKKWGHPIYEDESNFNSTNGTNGTNGTNVTYVNSHRFCSVVRNPFNKVIGRGHDFSKKKAEQNASYKALQNLGVIIDGEIDPEWINKIERDEPVEKEKEKIDKKTLSVFNPQNELLKKSTIKTILENYGVVIKEDTPINLSVFNEAMTHRSYLERKNLTKEDKEFGKKCVKLQKKSNERMQFLGDAVIHFILGEFLYHRYRNEEEGFLTRLRCKLENRDSLYFLAKESGVGDFVLISQAIEVLHGRNNVNIIGGGFEAFVGALYLELGLNCAREFTTGVLRIELDLEEIAENETNYKDLILQLYNRNHWGHPQYKVIKEEGPDHSKLFTIGLHHNGKFIGKGTAPSKKKAEQLAAKEGLEVLK